MNAVVNGRRIGFLAAGLIALPAVAGILYALVAALGVTGPGARGIVSFDHFAAVLSEPAVRHSVFWTLWIAVAATAIATAAAIGVALVFRGGHRGDASARVVAALPLPLPQIVAALMGVWILAQSGLVARAAFAFGWIDAPSGMPALVHDARGAGLILTLAWKEFAFLVIVAWSVLGQRTRETEEAARTLGASAWSAATHVTLPVLWCGMLPAIVAVFTFVLGSYEAAALLGPSRPLALPVLTYERYVDPDLGRRGEAFVLVLIGMALALAAVLLHERARMRSAGLDDE